MPNSSDPINVLVTVPFEDDLLEALRAVSDRIELLVYPAREVTDVPDDVWAIADVLYTMSVVPEPALAPNLRWIQAHSAGIDHLIQQPLIRSDDMVCTTLSGVHTTTMAEYTFMMMLAFGHRLPQILSHQAQADWPDEGRYATFLPLELRGSTVGIVGYGSIGREIARLANCFGMEVLATKRDVRHPADPDGYVLPDTGDPEGDYFHRLYPPEALLTMVRDCDFVVITVPLTETTRMTFGAEAFEAMRDTAFLINVGRGEVVDEKALLRALQEGQIAGAGFDVFAAEPLPADSPLWKQPNLIISPHIAGNTADYNAKAAALFVENLRRYVKGEKLLNCVNLEHGY
jgi:phosphoglycerate dehydrogenase-like enzyme